MGKEKEVNFGDVISIRAIDTQTHKFKNKDELFHYIASLLSNADYITDEDSYVEALYIREKEGSTYMGNGMVMPHGRSDAVKKPGISICRFTPMKYEEEEEELAEYAVALAIPSSTKSEEYMRILAKVACSMLDEDVVKAVRYEMDTEKIMDVLLSGIENN